MKKFDQKMIEEVQQQSLTSVIYNQLEDMILSGEIKPGERINESRLASELKVSRAPIREACRQLEKHGMVEIITRRGTFVAEIDVEEVKELYDIRALLDALAAEKATESATAADLEVLQVILTTMNDAIEKDSAKQYFRANMAFHQKIVELSKNSNLQYLIEGVYNKAALCRKTNLSFPHRISISYKQHCDVFKAMKEHRSDEAGKLMKHHVLDAKEALIIFLKQQEEAAI